MPWFLREIFSDLISYFEVIISKWNSSEPNLRRPVRDSTFLLVQFVLCQTISIVIENGTEYNGQWISYFRFTLVNVNDLKEKL